jgi:hypothetical protein
MWTPAENAHASTAILCPQWNVLEAESIDAEMINGAARPLVHAESFIANMQKGAPMPGICVASDTQAHVQNPRPAIVGARKVMLVHRGAVSRTGVSQSQVVRCALKAFCLAFASFVVLIAPAAAAENFSPTGSGAQNEEAANASLQTLLQKITSTDPGAPIATNNAADARFVEKVRAMLALANEEVRRAAASPTPVRIDVRLRCVAKRTTMAAAQPQTSSFVPALEWSVSGDAEPSEPAASKLVRACAFQLLRREVTEQRAPQMEPYTVQLPVSFEQEAR